MLPLVSLVIAALLLALVAGVALGARSRRVLHAIEADHERRLVESYAAGHLDGRAASSRRFRVLEERAVSLERVATAAERWAAGANARVEVVRRIAAHEREYGSLSSRSAVGGGRPQRGT